ncbi:hypothetical protein PV08_09997 [Exophiala spinifera]|uniref:Transcription factor domain-containing protein n=1 Tax=Exophiala spinifera TaxID=91928 RepID=A0A0D2BNK9_9EURO|nr:uncharacterized protein PV08_09997 [Exophiala spinifera]KIW12719.1 hypothetical protein PV08_09997 [Exophiala spinifera]
MSHHRRQRREHIKTPRQRLELSKNQNVPARDTWNMELLLLNGGAIDFYDPWQLSRGFRNDPFECVPGTNDGVQAVAFEYLTSYLFPSGDAISSAYGTSNWWRKLVVAMAYSAEVTHAVTCVLAATHTMVVTDSSPNGFKVLSPGILYHRGQAIRKLRLHLQQPNAVADDCAILTILFLGIFDKGVGDDYAATIHWRQLGQMVTARGGPQNITSELGLRDILVTFQQLSSATTENVSIPSSSIEPMVIRPQLYECSTSDGWRSQPVSFRDMFLHGSMCKTSMDVVLKVAQEERLLPNEKRRQQATERLLNKAPDLFVPQKASLLAKLVSLALLRYRVNAHTRVRHFVCPYEQAAWTLSEVLPQVAPPPSGVERDTLLWVWLVAVDAWSVSTTLKASLTTIGSRLFIQMAEKFPEIRYWEEQDFTKMGLKFFWYKQAPRWLAREWEVVKNSW